MASPTKLDIIPPSRPHARRIPLLPSRLHWGSCPRKEGTGTLTMPSGSELCMSLSSVVTHSSRGWVGQGLQTQRLWGWQEGKE